MSLSKNRLKSTTDYHLERRIALALLSVRSLKFRFLHVHAGATDLTELAGFRTRSVQLHAQNGAVTLTGQVPSAREKESLGALVQRVPGVVRVIDQVEVSGRGTAHFVPVFCN